MYVLRIHWYFSMRRTYFFGRPLRPVLFLIGFHSYFVYSAPKRRAKILRTPNFVAVEVSANFRPGPLLFYSILFKSSVTAIMTCAQIVVKTEIHRVYRPVFIVDLQFTVFRYIRVETVAITVSSFLELEQIATVVEFITPPARWVERIAAGTDCLQTKREIKNSLVKVKTHFSTF